MEGEREGYPQEPEGEGEKEEHLQELWEEGEREAGPHPHPQVFHEEGEEELVQWVVVGECPYPLPSSLGELLPEVWRME